MAIGERGGEEACLGAAGRIPVWIGHLGRSNFDKIIFICGQGGGTNCAYGTAPLYPFRMWAERNDYTANDFSFLTWMVMGMKQDLITGHFNQ